MVCHIVPCYTGIMKFAGVKRRPCDLLLHAIGVHLSERALSFEGAFSCPEFRKDGERVSKLTAKQQAWVDYYKQGKTAAEAARLAGYKARDDNGFQSIGSENLRKLAVYIAERDKILETPRIADMEEINAFWTNVMRDKGEETKERLKASELRAKAAGAFVQQIKLDNIPVVITGGDELED